MVAPPKPQKKVQRFRFPLLLCCACAPKRKGKAPTKDSAVKGEDIEIYLNARPTTIRFQEEVEVHDLSPTDRKQLVQAISNITDEDIDEFSEIMGELSSEGTQNVKTVIPARRLAVSRRMVVRQRLRANELQKSASSPYQQKLAQESNVQHNSLGNFLS